MGCASADLQKPDKKLGYVRIPVEEVARNKSMKDEWPLLEADKGDIQLRCLSVAAQQSARIPTASSVCLKMAKFLKDHSLQRGLQVYSVFLALH